MSKLTLLMVFCILTFVSARKAFIDPPIPCRHPYTCNGDIIFHCAKYEDGSKFLWFAKSDCPPCGGSVVGYHVGKCGS